MSCEDLGSVISQRSQRRVVGLLVLAGSEELGDCRARGARREVGAAWGSPYRAVRLGPSPQVTVDSFAQS